MSGVRRFAVLALPSFSTMTLAAVIEPLRVANRAAGRVLYAWQVLSEDGGAVASSSLVRLLPDAALTAASQFDALFVVASYEAERHASPHLLRLIRAAARAGATLGGMETAAYVLAAAGVLDGHRATTHWEDLTDFADRFASVEVVPDRFVIDRDRLTSGGATPTLDLMLELVQREHGPALALSVASAFIYARHHDGAEPQPMRALGRLAWRDARLTAALKLMERHIEAPLTVADIARRVGIGPRELHRRFRASLRTSPSAYYAELRLFVAKRLLEHTHHPVGTVAMMSGFESGSAFARAYRMRFGVAPSRERKAG